MKYRELCQAIRNVLPAAQIEEDNYGQIIIYTDLMESKGEIVKFEEEEDE